jgi:ribosomal protein S18 acetylase RimI-like enzyme
VNSRSAPSGPRAARFPQDVPQITELVELCFVDVLDYASRRMLRDVRAVARLGVAAWRAANWTGVVHPEEWVLSSVWEESGRIVGNVTLTRRTPERGAWLISNVAVHPDFRRRGIARALVRHALGMVREAGGRAIYLQVEADNETAVKIYQELTFLEIGRRIVWQRGRAERRSQQMEGAADSPCTFAERRSSEWTDEYALWKEVSPQGTAWNVPLTDSAFRPTLWKRLEGFLAGETGRHFLARCGGKVEGALSALGRFNGWEGTLIQREGTRGMVERGLLEEAWKIFTSDQKILLETAPEASADILVQLGFKKIRKFIWMRYTLNGGKV